MKAKTQKIKTQSEKYILPTYSRYSLALEKGKGSYVWDVEGNKYLDMVAGIAVNNLGHAHPEILKTIQGQSKKLMHCSNLYLIPEQVQLAQALVKHSGLHQAFFCNSGAESVEAAIKLARNYSLSEFKDKKRVEIIVAKNSFHGRTFAAISATAQKKYQQGFGPLVPGFKVVPFNDLAAVQKAVSKKTCAILVEPIQGEGGLNFPDKDYLQGLRKICDQQKLLLILDEVQTGIGRTGKVFAFQNHAIKPDLLTLAKGLGGGFPIGACVVNQKVAQAARPGLHASTFGGNPLAAAVALKVLETIGSPQFLQEVREKGKWLAEELNSLKKISPLIKEVRQKGLMVACELNLNLGAQIVEMGYPKGLLLNALQGKTVRLVPPLNISKADLGFFLKRFKEILLEISMV